MSNKNELRIDTAVMIVSILVFLVSGSVAGYQVGYYKAANDYHIDVNAYAFEVDMLEADIQGYVEELAEQDFHINSLGDQVIFLEMERAEFENLYRNQSKYYQEVVLKLEWELSLLEGNTTHIDGWVPQDSSRYNQTKP